MLFAAQKTRAHKLTQAGSLDADFCLSELFLVSPCLIYGRSLKYFSLLLVLFLNSLLELLLISHKTIFSWNSKVYVGRKIEMLSEIHCVAFV